MKVCSRSREQDLLVIGAVELEEKSILKDACVILQVKLQKYDEFRQFRNIFHSVQ